MKIREIQVMSSPRCHSSMKGSIGICVGLLFMVMNSGLHAADTEEHGHKTKNEELKELAMDVQNPVSDLWRFGFTNNTLFGRGPIP